jgi:hypothetical protein
VDGYNNVYSLQMRESRAGDELNPEPGQDPRDELDALERPWLDELQPCGERGYNRPSPPATADAA